MNHKYCEKETKLRTKYKKKKILNDYEKHHRNLTIINITPTFRTKSAF